MLPRRRHDHPARLAAGLAVLAACNSGSSPPGPAASAAPSASAAPAASSGGAQPATAPEGGGAAPRGAGVPAFTPIAEVAACKAKTVEVATYLQRHGLGLAGRGRDGTFAAVWLVELQNSPDAQIAFAGFDAEARQVARARSIGATRQEGLRIFETGGVWSVTWLGAEGLSHARPRWETSPPPEVQRLTAVGKEVSENVAIAASPAGSLVAAAPFGDARDQLGVFLFAPVEEGQQAVKALGVTHHAKQPRGPAVAADAGGYLVAWHEADGAIRASRFDPTGKEGEAHVIAAAVSPGGAAREGLALAAVEGGGAVAVWGEGDTIVARGVDGSGRPGAAPHVVGKGKARAVSSSGKGAFVAWIGNDGKADGQLLLARIAADGAPSDKGLRVSDGATPVKDPPAVALAGERVGVAWTEVMSAGVSTKRAVLRVLDAACVP